MSKHTPGPWIVNTDPHYEDGKPGLIWGPSGPGYGSICELSPVYPREFKAADAALIAAAPDLLAACEDLLCQVKCLGGEETQALDFDQAEAAIAKAKQPAGDPDA